MKTLRVDQFFSSYQEELGLTRLGDAEEGSLEITQADFNRPGLCLTGFTDSFMNERIQLLGEVEQSYLASLSAKECRTAIRRLFAFRLPCVITTQPMKADEWVVEEANRTETPLFRTSLTTSTFQHHLAAILDEYFAPEVSVHGTLVDVYGTGLLFTGRSAIGKSECALDLIERGHRLVADDMVSIKRVHENILMGTGNEVLTHHVEIRGIGIIDVRAVFGIRAVRGQKRVEVEVNLRDWDTSEDYERLGLEGKKSRILGLEIPLVEVPIFPGKNITVIAEVIALNYLVKAYGYDSAQAFSDRLLQTMEDKKRQRFEAIARGDRE